MSKPVDTSKKSNIKCEHCLFAAKDNKLGYYCSIHDKSKNYWNRCKDFKWDIKYR